MSRADLAVRDPNVAADLLRAVVRRTGGLDERAGYLFIGRALGVLVQGMGGGK